MVMHLRRCVDLSPNGTPDGGGDPMGRKTRQGEGGGTQRGAGGDDVVDEHDPRTEGTRESMEPGGGSPCTGPAGMARPPDAGAQQGEDGEVDATADPTSELGGGVDAVADTPAHRPRNGHEDDGVAGNEGGHGRGEGVGGGEVATVLEIVDRSAGRGLVGVGGADDEPVAEMTFTAATGEGETVRHRRTVPRRRVGY